MIRVISLGGSIVAPNAVDEGYLREFGAVIREFLAGDEARKVVLVVGGGAPARDYQRSYRNLCEKIGDKDEEDWIGIYATRLNGRLLRAIFRPECTDPLVTDPSGTVEFTGKVLVGAGWKPGFSTDYDAVVLAQRFDADTVINLSNIARVFTADPKLDKSAKPLDRISWNDFRKIVGDKWNPGANLPFDPIAARKASELGLKVIVADGHNIDNLRKILNGGTFDGTLIAP